MGTVYKQYSSTEYCTAEDGTVQGTAEQGGTGYHPTLHSHASGIHIYNSKHGRIQDFFQEGATLYRVILMEGNFQMHADIIFVAFASDVKPTFCKCLPFLRFIYYIYVSYKSEYGSGSVAWLRIL